MDLQSLKLFMTGSLQLYMQVNVYAFFVFIGCHCTLSRDITPEDCQRDMKDCLT